MDFQYFDDASVTLNSPVTERSFVCTERTPTRAVFIDVTETDPSLAYKITITTRPANTDTVVRQKVKMTIFAPAVINEGDEDEYIDPAIYRLEVEVPSGWSYTSRNNITANMIGKLPHLLAQADLGHCFKFGYTPDA